MYLAISWNFNKFLVINGVPRRRFTADVSLKNIELIMDKLLIMDAEREKASTVVKELR